VRDHCFCWPPPTRNTPLSTLCNIRSKFDRSCYPRRLLRDDRLCVVSSITGLTTRHGTFGVSSIPTGAGADRRLSCLAPVKALKTGGADEMGVTSCLIKQDRKQTSGCWRHKPSSATRAHPEAGFAITQQDMSQRISAVPNAISNPIVDIQRGYSCGHVGYTVD